mmetsp:Transcript_8307/g.12741  ORF Transcript_8307/g.12741 Transcript_8307/m.12741 type:complete len:600 (-) Transcript_8307:190-1989(-)
MTDIVRHHALSTMTSSNTNTVLPMNRRKVARAFKMRGLAVQASALDAMMNVLRRESPSACHEILQAVLDEIRERSSSKNSRNNMVVTKRLLAQVVADMSRDAKDLTEESLQLLDAFDTPRLNYDTMRKQWTLLLQEERRSLLAEAHHKPDMFAQRYALVRQRILRQDLFRPKLVTADGRHAGTSSNNASGSSATTNSMTHAITPVESLLGRSGVKFLLGMIVQVEEGRYYLEDHTAQVPLDLSHASVLTDGFISENCIVLVEGELVDGVLVVHRLGNPIVESRLEAIDAIGIQSTDIFQSVSTVSELEKLRQQEAQHGPEGMFVILSDVHLDKPGVLDKLQLLFEGYQHFDPLPVFVLMGDFCSSVTGACSQEGMKVMMGCFEELANVIASFPKLAQDGRFVFVPGPNDPGALGGVLPRPPLPPFFTNSVRSKVSHALFVSNPCRIRFFSRELVFFRQNLVHTLRRNCILPPNHVATPDDNEEDSNTPKNKSPNNFVQHAVKTIMDQGHLCPVSSTSCPIYWQYDHALRMYPLPDAVILGDCVDQFFETYAECDAINPGSFSEDFNFVMYRPTAEIIQDGDDSGTSGQVRSDVEFSQIE